MAPAGPEPTITSPDPGPPTDAEPYDPGRARALRRAGVYTMIGGGTVALTGLVLGIAFTVRGNSKEAEALGIEDQLTNDGCTNSTSSACANDQARLRDTSDAIQAANTGARVGGILLLTGAVAGIAGGVIYRVGVRKGEPPQARLRVSPTLGGAVLSGRF